MYIYFDLSFYKNENSLYTIPSLNISCTCLLILNLSSKSYKIIHIVNGPYFFNYSSTNNQIASDCFQFWALRKTAGKISALGYKHYLCRKDARERETVGPMVCTFEIFSVSFYVVHVLSVRANHASTHQHYDKRCTHKAEAQPPATLHQSLFALILQKRTGCDPP